MGCTYLYVYASACVCIFSSQLIFILIESGPSFGKAEGKKVEMRSIFAAEKESKIIGKVSVFLFNFRKFRGMKLGPSHCLCLKIAFGKKSKPCWS